MPVTVSGSELLAAPFRVSADSHSHGRTYCGLTEPFHSTDTQPFELLDFVGLDTCQFIAEGWVEKAKDGLIPHDLVVPPQNIVDLVKEGKRGRKSGAGFYDYTKK